MYQQIKKISVVATVLVLAACQTTPYTTKREVDPSETLIRFPVELNDVKGFKFKGARIYTAGSYERQTVYFTGGWYAYERYFFGGFYNVTDSRFLKRVNKIFPAAQNISPIQTTNMPIGVVHYVTLEEDDQSCFFMQSNYGAHLSLRNGRGTEGMTEGRYCASGKAQNLDAEILDWLKKVRLSHS